jgi:hypothetical protein
MGLFTRLFGASETEKLTTEIERLKAIVEMLNSQQIRMLQKQITLLNEVGVAELFQNLVQLYSSPVVVEDEDDHFANAGILLWNSASIWFELLREMTDCGDGCKKFLKDAPRLIENRNMRAHDAVILYLKMLHNEWRGDTQIETPEVLFPFVDAPAEYGAL